MGHFASFCFILLHFASSRLTAEFFLGGEDFFTILGNSLTSMGTFHNFGELFHSFGELFHIFGELF